MKDKSLVDIKLNVNSLTEQRHLIIVNYAYQSDINTAPDLLKAYFTLSCWAKACALTNTRVTVFQRFKTNQTLSVDGVDYVFCADKLPPLPSYYQCTYDFNRKIKDYLKNLTERQVTLHINGLIFPLSVLQLTRNAPKKARVIIQHHAEQPTGKFFKLLNGFANESVDAFFFTTKHHAQPWISAKIIAAQKVVQLMECSSSCQPIDKPKARQKLGLTGQPLLLWTANLDENKDPLTILAGFEAFLDDHPQAKLVMIFRHYTLLSQVKKTIEASDKLSHSVEMIGEVSYQNISDYYNAADIFVQGSAREGSGVAVLDALSCGAIPVISNIPSFAMLTDNASVGKLWQRGEVDQFVKALCTTMTHDLPSQQRRCIALFNQRWTFDALAKQAMAYYFESHDLKGHSLEGHSLEGHSLEGHNLEGHSLERSQS